MDAPVDRAGLALGVAHGLGCVLCGDDMTIKVVEKVDSGQLNGNEIYAEVQTHDGVRQVFIVRHDYYESGGVCYSGIHLTRADLDQLVALINDPR